MERKAYRSATTETQRSPVIVLLDMSGPSRDDIAPGAHGDDTTSALPIRTTTMIGDVKEGSTVNSGHQTFHGAAVFGRYSSTIIFFSF
jgi:hypothetical protein